MSVTRTPRRNEAIRMREEREDAGKVAAIVGGLFVVVCFGFVIAVTAMGGRP